MIQDQFSDIEQYANLKNIFSAPPINQENIDQNALQYNGTINKLLFSIFVTYSHIQAILLPKIKLLQISDLGTNESKSDLEIFQAFINLLLNIPNNSNFLEDNNDEINSEYYIDLINKLNNDLALFVTFPDINDEDIGAFFSREINNRTLKRYVFKTEKQLKLEYDTEFVKGIVGTMQLNWAIFRDHAIARGQNGQYYKLNQNGSPIETINPPELLSDITICCYQQVYNKS